MVDIDNEIQEQLRQSVSRFAERSYSFAQRNAILASGNGWSADVWRTLAELGLLAINVPERCGGAGLDAQAIASVMTCFGRCLLAEPYLSSAVVATNALSLLEPGEVVDQWLSRLACGEAIALLAQYEPGSRFDLDAVETTATEREGGYRLDGVKIVRGPATAADAVLVGARLGSRIAMFLVERGTPGMRIRERPSYDGQRIAEVSLDGVRIPASALLHADALPVIERAIDFGIAALCAEAAGLIEETNRRTLEYLKVRKQFGKPIGSFQVLQHRMVDMTIHQELVSSMAWLAAREAMSVDRELRRRALSAAKVVTVRAARFVSQQSIQLHGGMGMTDEMEVSHYARRLTALQVEFGDEDQHVEEFSEVLDLPGPM